MDCSLFKRQDSWLFIRVNAGDREKKTPLLQWERWERRKGAKYLLSTACR